MSNTENNSIPNATMIVARPDGWSAVYHNGDGRNIGEGNFFSLSDTLLALSHHGRLTLDVFIVDQNEEQQHDALPLTLEGVYEQYPSVKAKRQRPQEATLL